MKIVDARAEIVALNARQEIGTGTTEDDAPNEAEVEALNARRESEAGTTEDATLNKAPGDASGDMGKGAGPSCS